METSDLKALLAGLASRSHHAPRDDIVRLAVRMRARDACEFCLMPSTGSGHFHVEAVIPPSRWDDLATGKHDGRSGPEHVDNYAWICPFCDHARGARVEVEYEGALVRLFDPRADRWAQHFLIVEDTPFIVGHTAVGRATDDALGFNDPRAGGPLIARHESTAAGLYPPRWARPWATPAEPATGRR